MDTIATHYRTCSLCEATCGLEIRTRGPEIVSIRGDEADPFSRGYLCPKGPALKHLHDDPDRLREPMIRRGATWERVGWGEAFAEIDRRLPPIIRTHGRDAVAVYLGNPSAHLLSAHAVPARAAARLGTRNLFSASTVDQMPKQVERGLMFGTRAERAGARPRPHRRSCSSSAPIPWCRTAA